MAEEDKIWDEIRREIDFLSGEVKRSNFILDVAWRLYVNYNEYLSHRPELNVRVLSVYWALEILKIWEEKRYPLDAKSIFIETQYYSYLHLLELNIETLKEKESPEIKAIDFIVDTTDLKKGDNLY